MHKKFTETDRLSLLIRLTENYYIMIYDNYRSSKGYQNNQVLFYFYLFLIYVQNFITAILLLGDNPM